MPKYVVINNVTREITQQYAGVNNVAREVSNEYVGVNNVARECFANISSVSSWIVATGTNASAATIGSVWNGGVYGSVSFMPSGNINMTAANKESLYLSAKDSANNNYTLKNGDVLNFTVRVATYASGYSGNSVGSGKTVYFYVNGNSYTLVSPTVSNTDEGAAPSKSASHTLAISNPAVLTLGYTSYSYALVQFTSLKITRNGYTKTLI